VLALERLSCLRTARFCRWYGDVAMSLSTASLVASDRSRSPVEDDAELVKALAKEEFRGSLFNRFGEDIARYGLSVMVAWISTGSIFRQAAKLGRQVPLPSTGLDQDDVRELAHDTVAKGFHDFCERLRHGDWTPDGGASLATYFIGTCTLAFPNVYRRWYTLRKRVEPQEPVGLHSELFEKGRSRDPADTVAAYDEARNALDGYSEVIRTVVILCSAGYSHAEIAELLSVSPRAVEGRLARFRKEQHRVKADS
jgi:DNA-directed RNA polymerase specialized sigma24 family protein